MKQRDIKDKKIYAFFLVFIFMVGNVYSLPQIKILSFGELFLILYVIFILLFKIKFVKKFKYNRYVIIFILYSIFIVLLNCLFYNLEFKDSISRLSRDAFYYFVLFFIGTNLFDINEFKKMVNIFCILLSTYVIFQFTIYRVFNVYVPGFLLNTTINSGSHYGLELYNHYLNMAKITGYLKCNGFLCEPANCAQCFLVGLILNLNYQYNIEKNFKTLLLSIYITIGALLTFSANALIFCAFAWSMFLVDVLNKKKINKKEIWIITVLLCSIVIGSVAISKTNFSFVIERVKKASSNSTDDGSTQYRIYKGFHQFGELPIVNKIFGIGFGNYNGFYKNFIFNNENEYMNSLAYILMSTGIIGLIIYLNIFLYNWREKKKINKIAMLGLLIMMLSSSVYSSPIYVWLVSLIICNVEKGESNAK